MSKQETIAKLTDVRAVESILSGEIAVAGVAFDFHAVIKHSQTGFSVLLIDGIDVQDPAQGPMSEYNEEAIFDAVHEFLLGDIPDVSVVGEVRGEGPSINIDIAKKEQTLCRKRTDIEKRGLDIPAVNLGTGNDCFLALNSWWKCEQPEALEDEQFNVLVNTDAGRYAVMSIDLEFKSGAIHE